MLSSPVPKPASLAATAVLLGLALAGCEAEPSPAERQASDARAVAQVEALQNQAPPLKPLILQPILFDDIQRNDLFGSGCAFAPGGSMGAVLLAQESGGFVKVGGKVTRLAADAGSEKLPLGGWSRYTGKEYVIRLATEGEGGTQGAESLRWPGRLTVSDPYERAIYDETGSIECRS